MLLRWATRDVGIDLDHLTEWDRAALADANAELDAAVAQIVQFARVTRIQTVATPAGAALDIDSPTGSQ